MPQRGPRGVPETELRNRDLSAMAIAAATAVPLGTLMRCPSTEMVIRSCKSVSFIGESSVSMDVEDGMPPEDPSDYPGAQIIVEPPNCASCFR